MHHLMVSHGVQYSAPVSVMSDPFSSFSPWTMVSPDYWTRLIGRRGVDCHADFYRTH